MQIAMLLFPAEERRPPGIGADAKKDEAEASSFFVKN